MVVVAMTLGGGVRQAGAGRLYERLCGSGSEN